MCNCFVFQVLANESHSGGIRMKRVYLLCNMFLVDLDILIVDRIRTISEIRIWMVHEQNSSSNISWLTCPLRTFLAILSSLAKSAQSSSFPSPPPLPASSVRDLLRLGSFISFDPTATEDICVLSHLFFLPFLSFLFSRSSFFTTFSLQAELSFFFSARSPRRFSRSLSNVVAAATLATRRFASCALSA